VLSKKGATGKPDAAWDGDWVGVCEALCVWVGESDGVAVGVRLRVRDCERVSVALSVRGCDRVAVPLGVPNDDGVPVSLALCVAVAEAVGVGVGEQPVLMANKAAPR